MYTKGELEYGVPEMNDMDDYLAVAFLPHSCGEWVIGGSEEVANLIEDLQQVLKNMPTVLFEKGESTNGQV